MRRTGKEIGVLQDINSISLKIGLNHTYLLVPSEYFERKKYRQHHPRQKGRIQSSKQNLLKAPMSDCQLYFSSYILTCKGLIKTSHQVPHQGIQAVVSNSSWRSLHQDVFELWISVCILFITGLYLQHLIRCLDHYRFWVSNCQSLYMTEGDRAEGWFVEKYLEKEETWVATG